MHKINNIYNNIEESKTKIINKLTRLILAVACQVRELGEAGCSKLVD